MGAAFEDARERVVPSLAVSNSGWSEEGGHEHGPRKGPVDGVARELPSCALPCCESDAGRRRAGPVTVDEGSSGGESKGREALRIEERGGGAPLTRETPVLVHHRLRDQEGAALDLHSALESGSEVVRSKRDGCPPADQTLERRVVVCSARGHRISAGRSEHHARRGADTAANRSCRVHGRRRDRPRGKAQTEAQTRRPAIESNDTRDLTSDEFECSVIRLEQDPILEPVRILSCPASEGLEISSFLEPAPNYHQAYHQGINVGRLAGNEAACFSLYDPNNILPKSRAGSIAKILEGPNRAVKDINRKVLAMARAMTPAWSLRLLGVSCGSVVCAWGLLLILSVLGGGASHGTALGSFGLGSLSGAMEDMNSARCPWLCTCTGQEVDCSHRGLTQIPGDLVTFLVAEKL